MGTKTRKTCNLRVSSRVAALPFRATSRFLERIGSEGTLSLVCVTSGKTQSGFDKLLTELFEEFCHAAGSLVDALFGDRIRKADVLARAEGFAGHGDDVSLVKQTGG